MAAGTGRAWLDKLVIEVMCLVSTVEPHWLLAPFKVPWPRQRLHWYQNAILPYQQSPQSH